ncbi:hypothetical protein [Paenibacillus abyssi]|uniref:Uncharacterized protein n=1 Tax=Paenibacillus abyssi TaxID=1340531 RepID=A0A917FV24_9BACL|nr:hypothetical protein [Paenibacillus abyssi]GGG03393.1 hypothetical protein GCM10010916_20610 [Paenibacillus abyssi]
MYQKETGETEPKLPLSSDCHEKEKEHPTRKSRLTIRYVHGLVKELQHENLLLARRVEELEQQLNELLHHCGEEIAAATELHPASDADTPVEIPNSSEQTAAHDASGTKSSENGEQLDAPQLILPNENPSTESQVVLFRPQVSEKQRMALNSLVKEVLFASEGTQAPQEQTMALDSTITEEKLAAEGLQASEERPVLMSPQAGEELPVSMSPQAAEERPVSPDKHTSEVSPELPAAQEQSTMTNGQAAEVTTVSLYTSVSSASEVNAAAAQWVSAAPYSIFISRSERHPSQKKRGFWDLCLFFLPSYRQTKKAN